MTELAPPTPPIRHVSSREMPDTDMQIGVAEQRETRGRYEQDNENETINDGLALRICFSTIRTTEATHYVVEALPWARWQYRWHVSVGRFRLTPTVKPISLFTHSVHAFGYPCRGMCCCYDGGRSSSLKFCFLYWCSTSGVYLDIQNPWNVSRAVPNRWKSVSWRIGEWLCIFVCIFTPDIARTYACFLSSLWKIITGKGTGNAPLVFLKQWVLNAPSDFSDFGEDEAAMVTLIFGSLSLFVTYSLLYSTDGLIIRFSALTFWVLCLLLDAWLNAASIHIRRGRIEQSGKGGDWSCLEVS